MRIANLRQLRSNTEGSMAIETAVVAPILLVLSLGGVEAGSMVARQSELQSAAAEALNIVQAVPPGDEDARGAIRDVLKASTGITDDQDVGVVEIYRCGTATTFEREDRDDCGTAVVATYIEISLQETYEPTWTAFGIGSGVTYRVERTVQIS